LEDGDADADALRLSAMVRLTGAINDKRELIISCRLVLRLENVVCVVLAVGNCDLTTMSSGSLTSQSETERQCVSRNT